ncbi:carboxypeptidase-like regulatory domain-containing protein [Bacteroides sp.]|uniref:carboxypeptidase-like regulatory domain-containing protein n=1 Tax=Bacteroides sp. TaxID=29523 RepID=UPI003A929DDE
MRLIQRIVWAMVCVCAALPAFCQNPKIQITGTVMDDDGLPAMSIVIRDKTENGEVYGITDYDGNFKIKADPATSLHFSGLTYAPKVVRLKGKQHINVVMSFDTQQLDEVVVIAKRITDKLAPEPTDIEIVGNQYIIRPKVKIPREMFKSNSRVIVQPMLVNITRGTQRLFRPAVVTGREYAIALERMLEFDLTQDPLHPYHEKSKRIDGNEVIAYVDSLYLDDPDDECRCDIFMYLVNYRRATYQDTVVIAKGTINPMRFFDFNIGAKKITDEKYVPRPKKQSRADKGRMNLTFLINSARIDDSDPDNAVELEKMRDRLSLIDNDPNAEFMAFSITAISSPEGPYQSNLKLAWKRATTAKGTILKFLNPGTVMAMRDSIRMDAQVDTWGSVAALMEKDSVSAQGIREAIARHPDNPESRYRQIMRLPNYHKVIFSNYLKRLRRVEYSFSYSVTRLLNDEEIRRMYEKNYKDLVQYEFWRMYVNAGTDEQREKICRQALEVYPKFMLPANELAVILIERKEPDVGLLEPFITDRAPQELLCNHIIALLNEKDYVRADSIASMLTDSPVTADVKALAAAFNGNFQMAYDRFASRGGINEVVLLLALKRNEEAYDKADELPDEALTYYLRAVAANRLDKITDAFANLKKAFAADPKLKDVARIDGDVTDMLQQLEEEEKEKAEQAKEKKNKMPEAEEKKKGKKPGKEREIQDAPPAGNGGIRMTLNAIRDTTAIAPVVTGDTIVTPANNNNNQ